MVKSIKVSDKDKPWNRKRPKRSYKIRPKQERFLIICEGEKTEPNYFKALASLLPKNVVKLEPEGYGKNTLSLVDEAIERRNKAERSLNPFDHVWVVFDRDSFNADDFDNAIHKAESNDISVAWSNEAFELWYILHYDDRKNPMPREDYPKNLKHFLNQPYKKNSENMYYLLQIDGNEIVAIQRSENLFKEVEGKPNSKSNPCTTVHKLVDKLNEFKKVGV